MSVPVLALLFVFAIPILGIALAGYKEWLKFKSKHRELGSSTREVEARLNDLQDQLDRFEQERDALLQRLQNLETIVTSEAWIAQHDDSADVPPLDATGTGELELPSDRDDAQSEAEHTAEIARRLRGQ